MHTGVDARRLIACRYPLPPPRSTHKLPAAGMKDLTLPGEEGDGSRGGAVGTSAAHSASTTTDARAAQLDLNAVPYVVACVTGGGGGYGELVRNWVANAKQAGLHFLVGGERAAAGTPWPLLLAQAKRGMRGAL